MELNWTNLIFVFWIGSGFCTFVRTGDDVEMPPWFYFPFCLFFGPIGFLIN